MNAKKLVLLSAAGMAATSLAVWFVTGPAQGSRAERDAPATEVLAEPAKKAPDRSSFLVGGTLMMEGRLGHAVLPAGSDTETFVSVAVNADASKRAAALSALNLAIVIDRSGSMKGRRLTNAIEAAKTAIAKLRDGDVVSLVAYNTETEIIIPATKLSADNRDELTKKVSRLRAGGDTCISCGINAAMRLARQGDAAGVSRILLLSDGLPTAGVRDELGFRRIAQSCQRMGVAVTTIGVDLDYNEQIMAAIARESNGQHFFVQDPASLAQIFDQEMETLSKTVATNASLSIELSDGVFVDQIFDRTFERRGTAVVVPLGAFAAAEKKTLLMRLRVPRGPAGERPIAAVRLDYDDLAEDKKGWCEGDLLAMASSDPSDVTQLDSLVSARVNRSETAAALAEANELFRKGESSRARGIIATRREALRDQKRKAAGAAPAGRGGEVAGDFEGQEQTLTGADKGFEPEASPADGATQTKLNQADAFDLSH